MDVMGRVSKNDKQQSQERSCSPKLTTVKVNCRHAAIGLQATASSKPVVSLLSQKRKQKAIPNAKIKKCQTKPAPVKKKHMKKKKRAMEQNKQRML